MHIDGPTALQIVSQQPDVWIDCNVRRPTGDGVRDPNFLLHGPVPGDMSRWFDTFDGLEDTEPDWYALHLPHPARVNTIFFIHGPMFPVGGWWTNLAVEYRDLDGAWCEVPDISITPAYDFRDKRGERQPFEPFYISFAPISTDAVRLIGRPGGPIRITSMAYLAAALATQEQADSYIAALRMPLPKIFQLLAPNKLWDLILNLRDVTKIAFDVQCPEGLGLDHFLDEERFQQFHAFEQISLDPSTLFYLLGEHEGWDRVGAEIEDARTSAYQSHQPAIRHHHGNLVWIAIPVVVNGTVLGTIENRNMIGLSQGDHAWHAAAPARLGIEPDRYNAALSQVPIYDIDRLQEIVRLIQIIVSLSQQEIHRGVEVAELRNTIEELATPVLPVWRDVLMVPLVGRIDEQRMQHLTRTLLQNINQTRATLVIIDVTGVSMLDVRVAADLAMLTQAAKLLGTRCIISGIRPEIADALVGVGANLAGVTTYPNLQAALASAIRMVERHQLSSNTYK